MSDYNDDSNDDLPHEGEGDVVAHAGEGQNVEGQYSEEPYAEEYVDPENSFYTDAYQSKNYYESSNEQVEPVIFVNQEAEEYSENEDIYSTELPNYQTLNTAQNERTVEYTQPDEYAQADEYTQPDEYAQADGYAEVAEYEQPVEQVDTTEYANPEDYVDSEGYVSAEAYIEPDVYAESIYAAEMEARTQELAAQELAAQELEAQGLQTEEYATSDYLEQNQTEQVYTETAYVDPNYNGGNYTNEPSYSETNLDQTQANVAAYDEIQITPNQAFELEEPNYEQAADGYEATPQAYDGFGQDVQNQEPNYQPYGQEPQNFDNQTVTNQPLAYGDEPVAYEDQPLAYAEPSNYAEPLQDGDDFEDRNSENIGYDGLTSAQRMDEPPVLDRAQQDFRQEYTADSIPRQVLPMAWVGGGIGLVLLLGIGFYYLYNQFVAVDPTSDVPVVLADKTDIKTFPNGEGLANGVKDNDRIQNNSTNAGQTTITEPALLDSREEVIDQPIKSEDRLETSSGVVVDNDDKDIQNVLTLIKSSADNVEILLKPDDVNQLDQNQISINGLDTILVDAKPIRLDDLIAQNSQQSDGGLEQVAAANVDDLPVVGEGSDNPFKDVLADDTNQLPEAAPLPETDLSNAIAIASNQAVKPVNVAPQPVSQPTAAPVSVPNSLSPQVVAASGGAYGVQLASLPNEAAARKAYGEILARYPSILAGYSPIIREANIPDKGIYYRVFAGPLVSYSDANQLCANLRSAGISGCFARKM